MSHVLFLVLLFPQLVFLCFATFLFSAPDCRWSVSHRKETFPCLLRVGVAMLRL